MLIAVWYLVSFTFRVGVQQVGPFESQAQCMAVREAMANRWAETACVQGVVAAPQSFSPGKVQ